MWEREKQCDASRRRASDLADSYFFFGVFCPPLGAANGEVAGAGFFDLSAFGFFCSRLLLF
jgi:hypothetical protein